MNRTFGQTFRRISAFAAVLAGVSSVFLSAETADGGIFRCVTREDGLAGESVARVLPYGDGRVCLATSDGVSLYDGERILNFPIGEGRPNYVYDIREGRDGVLYAATTRGVFLKRRGDGAFSRVFPQIERAECLLPAGDTLYVGDRDGFHICSDGGIRLVTVGASRMGVENGVRDIVPGADGKVWFLSRYALNRYSPSSGEVESVILTDRMPQGAALNRLAVSGGRFYIGTKNNGLYAFTQADSSVVPVPGVGNVVTTLGVTSSGDVTVSCDGAGAFVLDGASGAVKESFNVKADGPHRIPSDAVYCFTKDDRGVCWFGFYRCGMCHSYFSSPVFRRPSFGGFSTAGRAVRSFWISGDVKLIGTGEGLYCVDGKSSKVSLIPPSELGGSHIITAITRFGDRFYIATYDAGLHVLDPRTMKTSRVASEPLLSTTSVSGFAHSPDGALWVGTGEGIFVLDREGRCTGRFTENNSKIGGSMVSGMLFDSEGNCWVCSKPLSLYISGTGIFESSNFPKGFFDKEDITGCTPGHGGLIYFSSKSGIYRTDPKMNDFGTLDLPEAVMRGTCYAFLDDGKGSLWLATSDGLFSVPYSADTFRHFGYGEGMKCRNISSGGLKMDEDGNIWVGTSDGLMELDPEALEKWETDGSRKVVACEVRVGGNLLGFIDEDAMNTERRISLGWNLASERLSLRFHLRDYARPYDRIYQYRIDDEGQWRSARDGEDVVLDGLGLGRHSLTARLSGAEGTESRYEILVLPSAAAMAEAGLLILAACLLLMWRSYHRDTRVLLRERGEIENALMEAEKESEALRESEESRAERNGTDSGMDPGAENHSVDDPNAGDAGDAGAEREKYARVRLDEAECAETVSRLREYIETSRCYTDSELKMGDVAEVLGLSSSRLSQIFSLHLKENWYDFINRYRLEEYKRLLADPENRRRYTLTALSEQCGFRKSSFYSTFRRVEGMTPAEYLKKHNIKL